MMPPYPAKVTIVGPGKVGMSLASYLMTSGVAREIVLVGSNHAKAEGEAMDLMHAQASLQIPVLTRTGYPSDAAGSAVVVITASAPTPAGMTDRNALATDNAALLRRILPPLAAAAPNADSILLDSKRTMPLSVRIDGYLGVHHVCLSLPVVIGASGVERVLHPPLNPAESLLFTSAAHAVRHVIHSSSPAT